MRGGWRFKRRPSRPRKVKCAVCGRTFTTRHSRAKYCRPKCQRIGWRAHWNLYGAKNRERKRAYHREHYLKNRKKILAKQAARRAAKRRETK